MVHYDEVLVVPMAIEHHGEECTLDLLTEDFAFYVPVSGDFDESGGIVMYRVDDNGELEDDILSDNFLAFNALTEEYERVYKGEVEALFVSDDAEYNMQEIAKEWGW